MKRTRHGPEQIIARLREADALLSWPKARRFSCEAHTLAALAAVLDDLTLALEVADRQVVLALVDRDVGNQAVAAGQKLKNLTVDAVDHRPQHRQRTDGEVLGSGGVHGAGRPCRPHGGPSTRRPGFAAARAAVGFLPAPLPRIRRGIVHE